MHLVGVEGIVDDAHLGASHGPGISLAKDIVHQEGGEVANGRVLDGSGLLTHVVRVPENRNLLPGVLRLLDSLLSSIELPSSGEPEATTKFLRSEDMQLMVQSKAYSGASTEDGEVVMEGREELQGGTLVGVLVQRCKDLHAGIVHQQVKVAAEALVGEELGVSPLCREHPAFSQTLVLLVEVALETVPLPTRLLARVGVAARATSTTG